MAVHASNSCFLFFCPEWTMVFTVGRTSSLRSWSFRRPLDSSKPNLFTCVAGSSFLFHLFRVFGRPVVSILLKLIPSFGDLATNDRRMAVPRRASLSTTTGAASSGQPASDFVARIREIHKGGWLTVHRQADHEAARGAFGFAGHLGMVKRRNNKNFKKIGAFYLERRESKPKAWVRMNKDI